MYLSRPAVEVVSDVVDAAPQLSDALHDRLELGPTQPRSKDALCYVITQVLPKSNKMLSEERTDFHP